MMVAASAGIALLPASLTRVVGTATAVIPLEKAPSITHAFARPAGTPSQTMKQFAAPLTA